jgi:hypothetical protein
VSSKEPFWPKAPDKVASDRSNTNNFFILVLTAETGSRRARRTEARATSHKKLTTAKGLAWSGYGEHGSVLPASCWQI